MTKRIDGDSKTAIAYLRLSPKRRNGLREEELGMTAQKLAIEAWARANGVNILGYCVDSDVSGATPMEDRPALNEAFSLISAHRAGLLLIARRDRLARDVTNACLIERMAEAAGSRIHSVDGAGNGDSPTDEFTRHILNAVGQLERRIIAARTRAALAAKKANGERLGRPSMAETLPVETLQLIQNLYRSGNFSHDSLAAELNLRGVPTASGKGKWRKNTVQIALKAQLAA